MSPLAMLRAKDSAAAAASQAGGDAGAPRGQAGRPTVLADCDVTADDILAIKRLALTAGRWTDCVSMSLAVRQYAAQLPEGHAFKVWASARHSKHHLPASLVEALGFARLPGGGRGGRIVAHDQAPGRERLKYEATAPGCLRRALDGSRLLAGEVESWDDASVNFIFWHVIDGQVRFGRFQLLLGVDQASDFVVGFSFVARSQDSYRGEDAAGRAMWPTWAQQGAPGRVVLERGVWESQRVSEFLGAAGVERTTSYHPRTKLVEGVFNRLWKLLGGMPGNVGRERGEGELGTKLLMQARRRGAEACGDFLEIGEAIKRVTQAVAALNAEMVESRLYGRWVPAEKWAAEAAANRRTLSQDMAWVARSERRVVTVRRDGTVRPRLTDAWGITHEFAFGWAEGWKHQGSEVVVYFSGEPAQAAAEGAVVLARDGKTVLTARADALAGNALAGVELRRAANQSVRAEHRTLRPDGVLASWQSETREQDAVTKMAMSSGGAAGAETETDTGRNACATHETEWPARTPALPGRTPHRPRMTEAEIDAAFEAAALGG